MLADQPGRPPRIALAAPTGKAAARLSEALAAGAWPARPGRRRSGRRPQRGHPAPPARLAAQQSRPVPAPRRQPAAVRRRRGRRDVDGVADPDGAAAGGGPTRCPARAGRAIPTSCPRWRPGRCSPTSPAPSARPAEQQRSVVRLQRTWRYGGAIEDLARAVREADDGCRRSRCCGAAPRTSCSSRPTCPSSGPPASSRWSAAVAEAGTALRSAAADGDLPAALAALDRAPAALRAPPRAVRGGAVERRGRAMAGRGRARLRGGGRVVSRPAAAGDRQRLRPQPVQR